MYCASFGYELNKIYLYEFLDKQLQGEISAADQELPNIKPYNIYTNNSKVKSLLHNYLESLFLVCSEANDLIVKRDMTNNYVDDFVKSVKKILPSQVSFEDKDYQKFDWQIKKQLFLGDEKASYYTMVKCMRKLFYCLGEVGLTLPFPSVYAYITNLLRKDFNLPPLCSSREIKPTAAKVKKALKKIDVSNDFMLLIQLNSLLENNAIQNINTQSVKINSSLINIRKSFRQLYNNREKLLQHICSIYYHKGIELCKSHPLKNDAQKKQGHSIQIQKEESPTHSCFVCNEKTNQLFSINLLTDRQNTITVVCSSCLSDIANKLNLEAANRFSEVYINNQMVVSYHNYQYPTDNCDCCGSQSNAIFTISSAQNPDYNFCRKCFQKFADRISLRSRKQKK